MTRQDEIRREILLQLYAMRPIAMSPDRMQRDAQKNGYDYTVIEMRREAQFLADEKLLIEISDPGVTAKMYRIHANGVRHYEQIYAA